jgi:hypothetical protein
MAKRGPSDVAPAILKVLFREDGVSGKFFRNGKELSW